MYKVLSIFFKNSFMQVSDVKLDFFGAMKEYNETHCMPNVSFTSVASH